MALENYKVDENQIFLSLCSEKNLSINSKKKYRNCLKNYTNYHQLTLEELVNEAEEDEDNNVRPARRRIKSRLLNFRTHLINDLGYKAATIKTNMICAKALYRFYGIIVPDIPNAVLPSSPNESIEFEDLPTINHIKTAIESTKKAKHKALFLFAACNGCARTELSNFTYGQFLEGVKPFCHNPEKPQDIINDLDGKCEELEVIPVFKMKREKTNYFYYAPISPEATQFCINYLKAEGLGLKYDDPFFQLGPDGVSTAFKLINEKFQWGKRGLYGFFSSHRIRKFNASLIEDTDFANFIQGRKPGPIKEAYFKRDINRIREEYKKHMHKFTIYAHYDVMINSEAYADLQNQLKEERKERGKEKDQYENKIALLEKKLENQGKQITETVEVLNSITSKKTHNNMLEAIDTYCTNELYFDNPKEEELVIFLATDYAIEHREEFEFNNDYIAKLIKRIKIKIAIDGRSIEEQLSSYNFPTETGKCLDQVGIIIEYIDGNEKIIEMLGDYDFLEMENYIEAQLINSKYDVENLTEEDYIRIAEEAVLEYLS